jgi:pterin-4a-carbinolamine dehydratase
MIFCLIPKFYWNFIFDSIKVTYFCFRYKNRIKTLIQNQKRKTMTEFNATSTATSPLYTINNPESVIEVFLDAETGIVREVKCLNYNRCKEYTYSVEEYLARYSHHPAGKAVMAELELAIA